jgi:4-hydroxy-2-oxoheptanedioate aldolase
MGLIIPMINSVEDAQAAVDATRYAPHGTRSWGPVRPLMHTTATDYLQKGQFEIAVMPMIETVSALNDVEKIVQVGGVNGVYVGPSDLHIALGLEPSYDSDHPRFVEAIRPCVGYLSKSWRFRRHTRHSRIGTRNALRRDYRMINAAADLAILKSGMTHALKNAQG